MSEYRIAAIPTVYRGRQYRSRLEARWAAFFDVANWKHEYEPFDLGKWSPDFILYGAHGDILVEVKPISDFAVVAADKMIEAIYKRGLEDSIVGLLLLGLAPAQEPTMTRLGWFLGFNDGAAKASWEVAPLVWMPLPDKPVLVLDFLKLDISRCKRRRWIGWQGALTDHYGVGAPRHLPYYLDYNAGLWAQATNAVQWKPQGAHT